MTAVRRIDSKGRLLLESLEGGEYVVKPAIAIPVREKWLFENKDALNSVMLGIRLARKRKVAEKPAFSKKRARKGKRTIFAITLHP